jgi:hypothetical protein
MLAARLAAAVAPWQVPEPTGPEAPAELMTLVTRGLNFFWFLVLVAAFFTAMWGLGSMASASRKQNFGAVNDGKRVLGYSIAGAAGMTVLRSVFAFFGV